MMLNKTARPNEPLVGFELNNYQELTNRKPCRALVAAGARLASGCSGGAGAIAPITPISGGAGAPITPNSGSVTASSTQSMMRQSTVSSSAYGSAVVASLPSAYFRLDDSGATALDSSGHGYNMVMRSGVTKGSAGLVAGDTAGTLPGISNAADVITSNGRHAALEPANTVSVRGLDQTAQSQKAKKRSWSTATTIALRPTGSLRTARRSFGTSMSRAGRRSRRTRRSVVI